MEWELIGRCDVTHLVGVTGMGIAGVPYLVDLNIVLYK